MKNETRPVKRRRTHKPRSLVPTSVTLPLELQHLIIRKLLDKSFNNGGPYYPRFVTKLAKVSRAYLSEVRKVVKVHHEQAQVGHSAIRQLVDLPKYYGTIPVYMLPYDRYQEIPCPPHNGKPRLERRWVDEHGKVAFQAGTPMRIEEAKSFERKTSITEAALERLSQMEGGQMQ